uniref:DNA 3'-5' helicase n=1 Tax=Rhizophagus irregularis (strain DAOM 181602 / DAOM 197198 / MUCL 43194) TaxID=747089 RepID=U9UC53_RHIID
MYTVRYALAVIHNNSGLLLMLQNIRAQKGLTVFSEIDILNIEHISGGRESQRQRNQQDLQIKSAAKVAKIAQQKKNLDTFDFDQSLVPYGQKTRIALESKTFCSSFTGLICELLDISNKCISCQSFPKEFPNGYCKICNFWNYLGFTQRIPEINVQMANNEPNQLLISNKIPELNQILKQVFGFSSFREGQYEAICSFLGDKDTLVILRTGGGKTLCFAMAVLASSRLTVVFTPLKALIDDHVERVFSELSLGILPILFITPEKLEKNRSFYRLLQKIYRTQGIQFVIDEAHCILDYNNFRDSWTHLGNLKRNFPMSPIMLLTATCTSSDVEDMIQNNLVGLTGRCIIYCSGPNSCQEIFNNLHGNLTFSLGLYHGELDGEQRKIAIKNWQMGKIQIMIATNSFGMGINAPDVYLIIHTTIPLSMTNFIQEIGRAGRDGTPSKSIIFYSRNDIRTLFLIITRKEESLPQENDVEKRVRHYEGQQKFLQIAHFCETKYICRHSLIAQHLSWSDNISNKTCGVCDNCISSLGDKPVWNDFSADVIRLLKIAKEILISGKIHEMISLDIAAVFCKLKRANELGLSELPVYNEPFEHELCAKGFLVLNFQLRKTAALTGNFSFKSVIIGLGDNAEEEAKHITWKYCFKQ